MRCAELVRWLAESQDRKIAKLPAKRYAFIPIHQIATSAIIETTCARSSCMK